MEQMEKREQMENVKEGLNEQEPIKRDQKGGAATTLGGQTPPKPTGIKADKAGLKFTIK